MSELAQILSTLAHGEGYHATRIAGVGVYRSDRASKREPLCYRQGIIFMAQGTKRIYLDERVYEYNPDNYLVLTLPTPADCEALCRPGESLLSLVMDLDLTVLHEMVRVLDECRRQGRELQTAEPRSLSLFVSPVTADLSDSILRLARALTDPLDAGVLGQGLVREVLLHVLKGPDGASVIDLVRHNTHLARLEPVLQHVHTHYASTLDVEQLAALANMSTATFHRNFRRVTSMSPIQYIKRIRLTRARGLLLDEGVRVGDAAAQVGYESPSQFSREFKRYFGRPPQSVAESHSPGGV
ncbi:AraC family transcriptional regulator [Granulosicoccaceae sp. 1_MG-2023]|nr:AraC family transcriptional regulator [Granulosicoccaceae sp. 1_MG-2023]